MDNWGNLNGNQLGVRRPVIRPMQAVQYPFNFIMNRPSMMFARYPQPPNMNVAQQGNIGAHQLPFNFNVRPQPGFVGAYQYPLHANEIAFVRNGGMHPVNNRRDLVANSFSMNEWRLLQDDDCVIQHLEGDIWIGTDSTTNSSVWRCLDCFIKGNLPSKKHQDGEINRVHLVGMSELMEQKGCPDCGIKSLQTYPAGRCWICSAAMTDSRWNVQDMTPRMMELSRNYDYLRKGTNAIDWKPVAPENSLKVDLFLRMKVERNENGDLMYSKVD